jgi:ribosomal protein S18 acetylase RimI-like enzyme
MKEQTVIRLYSPADKEQVLQLFRLNTPKYFDASEEQYLLYYLDYEAEQHYVTEQQGKIVGCGGYAFSEDGHTGKICWDFFHPDQQGKGLGKILVEFRIAKMKENKEVKTISVRTSQMAFRFYGKLGFELKEVVKDHWAEGFDLYRMEMPA